MQAARVALERRRAEVARAITPGWQRQVLALPVTLENAEQISRDLARWSEVIKTLDPASQAAVTDPVYAKLDADLTVLIAPSLAALDALQPTETGITGWSAWQASFRRTFEPFSRPPVQSALATSAATRQRLLTQRLPSWRTEIARLPPAPDWLPTAWTRLHALFTDDAVRMTALYQEYRAVVSGVLSDSYPAWSAALDRLPPTSAGLAQARAAVSALFDAQTRALPEYARYKAASDRFVGNVLSRAATLADGDAAVSSDARQWFRGLVDARPVKGTELVASVRSVRLAFAFDDAATQARSSSLGLVVPVTRSLASIGIAIDPSSNSELLVTLGSAEHKVTTTLGIQRAVSVVFSVWAAASLRAPVIVARADGYHRIRAALASTIAAESVKTETFPGDAVARVADEAIANLVQDIDSRSQELATDAAWREDLLTTVPTLERSFRAFTTTATETRGGRMPSYTGITTVAPLRHGVSPFNRAVGLDLATAIFGDRFDPSAAWSRAFGELRWRTGTPGVRTPIPTHYYSAMPLSVHWTTGPQYNSTTMWITMQQTAIVEPNCVVNVPGATLRTPCLTADATNAAAALNVKSQSAYDAPVEKLLRMIRGVSAGPPPPVAENVARTPVAPLRSPTDGRLVSFDRAARTVSLTLPDGGTTSFPVDEKTTVIDARGGVRMLLRDATVGLDPGVPVRVEWKRGEGDRPVATMVMVFKGQ